MSVTVLRLSSGGTIHIYEAPISTAQFLVHRRHEAMVKDDHRVFNKPFTKDDDRPPVLSSLAR